MSDRETDEEFEDEEDVDVYDDGEEDGREDYILEVDELDELDDEDEEEEGQEEQIEEEEEEEVKTLILFNNFWFYTFKIYSNRYVYESTAGPSKKKTYKLFTGVVLLVCYNSLRREG